MSNVFRNLIVFCILLLSGATLAGEQLSVKTASFEVHLKSNENVLEFKRDRPIIYLGAPLDREQFFIRDHIGQFSSAYRSAISTLNERLESNLNACGIESGIGLSTMWAAGKNSGECASAAYSNYYDDAERITEAFIFSVPQLYEKRVPKADLYLQMAIHYVYLLTSERLREQDEATIGWIDQALKMVEKKSELSLDSSTKSGLRAQDDRFQSYLDSSDNVEEAEERKAEIRARSLEKVRSLTNW